MYIYFFLQADTARVAGEGAHEVTGTIITPSGQHEDITPRKTDDNKYDMPFKPSEKGMSL